MLVVETIAKIRRAYFQEQKTIKQICRDLGVSRNTVRKVIRSGVTELTYERTAQPLPKIGPWAGELDDTAFSFMGSARTGAVRPARAPWLSTAGQAEALAYRMGGLEELPEASRTYADVSLMDMAREAVERMGTSTRGMSRDEVLHRAAAHGTSDFALRAVIKDAFTGAGLPAFTGSRRCAPPISSGWIGIIWPISTGCKS